MLEIENSDFLRADLGSLPPRALRRPSHQSTYFSTLHFYNMLIPYPIARSCVLLCDLLHMISHPYTLFLVTRVSYVIYRFMCVYSQVLVVCSFPRLVCIFTIMCVIYLPSYLKQSSETTREKRGDGSWSLRRFMARGERRMRNSPFLRTHIHWQTCRCQRVTLDTFSQTFWLTFLLHFWSSKNLCII
jgi:hypothetical protein